MSLLKQEVQASGSDRHPGRSAGAVGANRLSLIGAGLLGLLLAGAWLGMLLLFKQEQDAALQHELRHNANLASALQEQTQRVFAAADQAVLRLGDGLREGLREGQALPDLQRLAQESGLAPRILLQLSLVGADGRFVASNLDPDGRKSGPLDLSDRQHIAVHLAPGRSALQRDTLFISAPVLGKVSNRWTIQLSRRIANASNQTLGVAVASLDPAYFEEIYRSVALGDRGEVSLLGLDGALRAQALGQGKGSPAQLHTLQPGGMAQERQGQFIEVNPQDGSARLIAFQRIGDYPLEVLVASAAEDTIASWRGTHQWQLLLAAMVTLCLIIGAGLLLLRLQRAEAELAGLRTELHQARTRLRARSEWLVAISHRLRSPLSRLLSGSAPTEGRHGDSKLHDQHADAEELQRLLEELVDLARLESGGMTLHREILAVHPLIQGVAEAQRAAAAAKGLALRVQFDPDVPEHLCCDGLRVRQLLKRLVVNALRYTEQGEVVIELDSAPGWVRIHVADTGAGMSAAQQAVIMPRLAERTDALAGGVGLTLARALARHMGGQLELTSVEGMGSRFTLSLPLEP